MKQNRENMLQRGERLDHLTSIAENLQDSSKLFERKSEAVARSYRRKNIKLIVGIVTVILVIIAIVLLTTGVIPMK